MNWIFLHSLVLALFLAGCNAKVGDMVDKVAQREAAQVQESCDRGECPCESPVGSIAHGSKVTVYSKDTASCTESCGTFAQELTCKNGKFDKELVGLSFTCETQDCPICFLGENRINNGESITTYSKDTVGCRESCDDFKQVRTCRSGSLSGTAEFNQVSCKRRSCSCPLPDGSGAVSLDGYMKLYSAERAACGSRCEANYAFNRQCVSTDNEQTFHFTGGDEFRYRSCEEATNCFCTLPNGLGILPHGQTRVISKTESVACGLSCSTQENIEVRCVNGALKNNTNLSQTIDFTATQFSGYKYRCTEESCVTCAVPGTDTLVPHGSTYPFAKSSSVGCSAQCEYKDRLCNNGTFEGDTSFAAASCAKRPCTCRVGGPGGNEIPVGSSWTFYSAAKAACGSNCVNISESRQCTERQSGSTFTYDFAGTPSFSFSSCEEATGCACALPNGLGNIVDGKTITLSSQATVACGTTCDQIPSLDVKCSNGILVHPNDNSVVDTQAPSFAYKYFCLQSNCASCTLPGYGTIPNGNHITLYDKDVMVCGDIPELHTFEFSCQNNVLIRNGNPFVPSPTANWYTSYSTNCPGCPRPGGGYIANDSSLVMYKWAGSVVNGCGRGCKSTQRKCENGILLGDPSYDMASCDNSCTTEGGGAPPRACLLPWQNTYVTPDAEIPVWRKKTVACGDSCQNYMKLAKCDMKTGTFKLPFEYIYQSCTEVCP